MDGQEEIGRTRNGRDRGRVLLGVLLLAAMAMMALSWMGEGDAGRRVAITLEGSGLAGPRRALLQYASDEYTEDGYGGDDVYEDGGAPMKHNWSSFVPMRRPRRGSRQSTGFLGR